MYEGKYEPGSKLYELDEYYKTRFVKSALPDEVEAKKRLAYSIEARAWLTTFNDDADLDHTLRNIRTRQKDPELDYHGLLECLIIGFPRAEHVGVCRTCGNYFDYEGILKPVNLKTGQLSIPVKCPDCSESRAYEKQSKKVIRYKFKEEF